MILFSVISEQLQGMLQTRFQGLKLHDHHDCHFVECIKPLVVRICTVLEKGGKGRLSGVRLSGKTFIAHQVVAELSGRRKLVIMLDFSRLNIDPIPPSPLTVLNSLFNSIEEQCQRQQTRLPADNIPQLHETPTVFDILHWWSAVLDELSQLRAVVIADNTDCAMVLLSTSPRFMLSQLIPQLFQTYQLGALVLCDGSIESELAIRGGPRALVLLEADVHCWSPCVVTDQHAASNVKLMVSSLATAYCVVALGSTQPAH